MTTNTNAAQVANNLIAVAEDQAFEAWYKQDCLVGGVNARIAARAAWNARAALTTAAAPAAVAGPSQETCQTCQGNGEVVTDWERYKHPLPGDVGDEAVAECQDCDGQGTVDAAPTTQAAPQPAVQQGDAEDAARLDFMIEHRAYVVSDPDACPGYWLHFVHKETGRTWVQGDEHPTPRAAIDAARSQSKEGA